MSTTVFFQVMSGLGVSAENAAQIRPELRRQSQDYAKLISGKAVGLPRHNHFTILEELASPHGALTGLVRKLAQ